MWRGVSSGRQGAHSTGTLSDVARWGLPLKGRYEVAIRHVHLRKRRRKAYRTFLAMERRECWGRDILHTRQERSCRPSITSPTLALGFHPQIPSHGEITSQPLQASGRSRQASSSGARQAIRQARRCSSAPEGDASSHICTCRDARLSSYQLTS